LFGRVPPGMVIEVTNWGVAATTPSRSLALPPLPPPEDTASTSSRMRCKRGLYLGPVTGTLDVPVLRRDDLGPGTEITGPALISEAQTTTYVPAAAMAVVDSRGIIRIDLAEVTA
jgi:N-methylhydantoinase A